jgi:hypothetical protein
MVQALGDQLLARAPLADDEHGPIKRRRAARALYRVEKCQALADELFSAFHSPTVGVESHVLARCFACFPNPKMADFRKSGVS